MKKDFISSAELSIFLFFTFLILVIISISYFNVYKYPKKHLKSQLIKITVIGEVKYPGTYNVYPGTTVDTLLKKAKTTESSDLSNLSLESSLSVSQKLVVNKLEEIKIYLSGAVEEKEVSVKPGTKMISLKKILTLKKDADLTFFKSYKKLKNNQKIKVPYIKDEN